MMKEKKVLLVSPYPFSLSSRGMDVLTQCFDEENWDVSHLTYPRVFYTPQVEAPKNTGVKSLFARKGWLPYIDRLMFWFPKIMFNIIKWFNNHTAKDIDFSQYDVIVLESGKPLFLMDLIPQETPIIYRLSDSVKHVLGRNKWYQALEQDVFQRSHRMVFKKEIYRSFLQNSQKSKTTVIENGMVIPQGLPSEKSFPSQSTNGVYVGLHQLDFNTVNNLVSNIPQVDFHIIGPCLSNSQVKKLSSFPNFKYYSFLSKEQYMPLLRDADFALFPFRRTEAMKWFGLTSKLLHFMYFNLPIISYPTGFEGEFHGIPIEFANSADHFLEITKAIVSEKKKIQYPIDFDFFSEKNRKEEYKKFIKTLDEDIK